MVSLWDCHRDVYQCDINVCDVSICWSDKMTKKKQRQITNKQQKTEPLDRIIEMLELPKKTHRDVYLALVERFLRRSPYNVNLNAFEAIGQRVGIESNLAKQKVIDLEAAGYVEWRNWCLFPIFHVNGDRDEAVIALREYQTELENKRTTALSSKDMYVLLNTICVHTKTKIDPELCGLQRWGECKNCPHRIKQNGGA